MTARNNARSDALSHPCGNNVITNLSFDPNEIACFHTEFVSMAWMYPERICMGNFIQPFRISTSSVNLDCQAEGRNQNSLIFFQVVWMDVAFEIRGYCVFGPA